MRTTSANTNGRAPWKTSEVLIFSLSSDLKANRFTPIGGVIRAISTITAIITPNQTSSKPSVTTNMGKNKGTKRRIIGVAGITHPAARSIKRAIARDRYGFASAPTTRSASWVDRPLSARKWENIIELKITKIDESTMFKPEVSILQVPGLGKKGKSVYEFKPENEVKGNYKETIILKD